MGKMDSMMPPGVGKIFGQANKFVGKIPGVNTMVNHVPGLNKLMPSQPGSAQSMGQPMQASGNAMGNDIGMAPTNMNMFMPRGGGMSSIRNPNAGGMTLGNAQGQPINQGGTGMEPTEQLKRLMMGMRF